MSRVTDLRNSLERKKGQLFQVKATILSLQRENEEKQHDLELHEQAKELIRAAGQKTQEQISFHISDITSMALEAVFPDPYQLKVDFVQRRNKTECDLLFVREEELMDPMESSGVGTIDIATFALRIACWSMAKPRTRNTIILDEPFHFLSLDLQEAASAMIKEVSKKLGLQFIIVTHNETLASYADRTFHVRKRKNVSQVKTI